VHVVGCGAAAIAGDQGHGAGRGRVGGRRGGAAGGRVSVTLGRLAGQVLVVCARVARDGDQCRRVGIRGRVVCSRRVGVVGFVVGGKGGFVCARVALVRARRALGNGVVRGGIRGRFLDVVCVGIARDRDHGRGVGVSLLVRAHASGCGVALGGLRVAGSFFVRLLVVSGIIG